LTLTHHSNQASEMLLNTFLLKQKQSFPSVNVIAGSKGTHTPTNKSSTLSKRPRLIDVLNKSSNSSKLNSKM
jgi:hypothetical protein